MLWAIAEQSEEFMNDLEHSLAGMSCKPEFRCYPEVRNQFMMAHFPSLPEGWEALVDIARDSFILQQYKEPTPPFGFYKNHYFVGSETWGRYFYAMGHGDKKDYAVLD